MANRRSTPDGDLVAGSCENRPFFAADVTEGDMDLAATDQSPLWGKPIGIVGAVARTILS
jgi:hypothetical protein